MYSHLANARHAIKRLPAKLHVIAVVFNPLRFQSRYNLFKEFREHAERAGATLWVCELAFGDRPLEIADPSEPRNIIFRTDQELWHKERMINETVARLPHDWQYVATIDADVSFTNHDWVHETMQQLQHYMIVQTFTNALDMTPNGDPGQQFRGFAYSYLLNDIAIPTLGGSKLKSLEDVHDRVSHNHHKPPHPPHPHHHPSPYDPPDPYYGGVGAYWHPGYGWAYRREAWNLLGGLLDTNIVGGGDYQMAYGLIGRIDGTIPSESTPAYVHSVKAWGEAAKLIKRNIGAVPGTIIHHYHGHKGKRGYWDRWKILTENRFDPVTDITPDWQRMWKLSGNKIRLRDDLRRYFRARNEDSID